MSFNAPLSNTAAIRAVGYYNRIAGYIDEVRPDLSVDENVNTGNRYGGRVAVTVAPNERFTITPRIVFQRMETDGWNRIDEYNILANPFTTTRPPVTFDDREQFAQLQEDFSDDFVLADVNFNYDFGTTKTLGSQTMGTENQSIFLNTKNNFPNPFPSWSLTWRGLEKVKFIDKFVKSASISHTFAGRRQLTWNGERSNVTQTTYSKDFRPMLSLNMTLKKKLAMSLEI